MPQDVAIAAMLVIGLVLWVIFGCHKPHQEDLRRRDADAAELAKYRKNKRILDQAGRIKRGED